MTSVTRFLDIIRRNLKSDAVPRPPRQDDKKQEVPKETPTPNDSENVDPSSDRGPEAEEILIEDLENDEEEKKNSFFKSSKKKKGNKTKKNEINEPNKPVVVNTQANGHVVNILNSKDVHWGNNYIYNMATTSQKNKDDDNEPQEEIIHKDNNIELLMEAKEEVEHEYMDFISKNLGKNWRAIFVSLGYTKGGIETFEIDEIKNGISEVRYKLLLDWVRNDDDPSLGHLTTLLWNEGEREIVKALSLIYKKNKKS